MADFPYIEDAAKRIGKFFSKIQSLNVPESASTKWLPKIGGFGSSKNRPLIKILKFIGFITNSNKPTKRWRDYRDRSQSKTIMAEGIKQGYSALFEQYSDAYRRDDNDLRNFFSRHSDEEEQVIASTVDTFKALCSLADFGQEEDDTQEDQEAIDSAESPTPATEPDPNDDQSKSPQADPTFSPELNINVQIHISSDAEHDQIDKIFESMAKHLFNRSID